MSPSNRDLRQRSCNRPVVVEVREPEAGERLPEAGREPERTDVSGHVPAVGQQRHRVGRGQRTTS